MAAYYNEFDKNAAAWLRELIKVGAIADGVVDDRSVVDVEPNDLRDFTQCHFFAGIGVWSYALRQAGWSDDRPVWTGSCPCQPFSAAGKSLGFDDERHLWPHWHHLIRERRPPVILGEQVASKDGLGWLDLVQADMEGEGYAIGAADLCAAGVGAPHIRQRLWFVAHSSSTGLEGRDARPMGYERQAVERGGETGGLAHSKRNSDRGEAQATDHRKQEAYRPADRPSGCGGPFGGLDDAASARHVGAVEGAEGDPRDEARVRLPGAGCLEDRHGRPGPVNGFWRDADWLLCRDGKWRPVESGTFPLAHGAPARVGRLRGYGNAINAKAAEVFIAACKDILDAA